jgi:hypothetical protein
MNKKVIWIGAGFLIVIGLLVGLKKAGVIGKEEGIAVTVEAVQLRTITESVNASGKVYPEIEVKVSPDISGEIVNLFVEEGDRDQILKSPKNDYTKRLISAVPVPDPKEQKIRREARLATKK